MPEEAQERPRKGPGEDRRTPGEAQEKPRKGPGKAQEDRPGEARRCPREAQEKPQEKPRRGLERPGQRTGQAGQAQERPWKS